MKILKIIAKNFKLLMRSKSSSLIVIFGPLIVIMFVGIAFTNASLYSIKVGFFSPVYNDLTNSFINDLTEQYPTTKYPSEKECVDDIKFAQIHTCIVFPENLGIQNDFTNEIVFYADYSRINLVYSVIDTISTSIIERSDEISVDLTTILLSRLDSVKDELADKRATLDTLDTENEALDVKISSISTKLAGLDLTFDSDSFKLGELKARFDSIDYSIGKAKISINDAISLVGAMNDSSTNTIINTLEAAITDLDAIGTVNTSNASTESPKVGSI